VAALGALFNMFLGKIGFFLRVIPLLNNHDMVKNKMTAKLMAMIISSNPAPRF
jgi:hypothetical protein